MEVGKKIVNSSAKTLGIFLAALTLARGRTRSGGWGMENGGGSLGWKGHFEYIYPVSFVSMTCQNNQGSHSVKKNSRTVRLTKGVLWASFLQASGDGIPLTDALNLIFG